MPGSKYSLSKLFVFIAVITGMLFTISSCHPLPNNGIPIYLQIDSPKVVVTNPALGSASSSIPDVWATTGSHNLGAYEMPVNIPVITGGSGLFAISAGIYDNGIVNAPVMYPFYAPDTFSIPNAIAGHLYHHKPTYKYYSNVHVALNETFDANTTSLSNITFMTNQADSNVYEGLRSGGIILPSFIDSLIALQVTGMQVITNGRPAYMELNYKLPNANTLLDVGIIGTITSNGQITEQTTFDKVILTNPIGVWNKVYLNFNNEIGTFNTNAVNDSSATYQIYLTGYHYPPSQQDTVFIDNVKLIYFQ